MTTQHNKTHAQRMLLFQKAGIYLVTSETLSRGRSTLEIIREALDGGISLIQLREKDLNKQDFYHLALKARAITAEKGALLMINDHLDIALATEADGVHLGQTDLPVAAARKLTKDLIVGASTHNAREAQKAEKDGASYVNIGPLFPTKTKKWDQNFLGLDGLRETAQTITIPFTVMGGIKKQHIPELRAAGAKIVALVTAITSAEKPREAATELISLMNS